MGKSPRAPRAERTHRESSPVHLTWILPLEGNAQTLTFSMPTTLTFSMLCCVPHNTKDVAGRIMWRTVRIVRLHMRSSPYPAT